jgi:hypothetical protein
LQQRSQNGCEQFAPEAGDFDGSSLNTLTLKLLLAVIRLLEIVANPGSRHVILIIGIYLKIFIILPFDAVRSLD